MKIIAAKKINRKRLTAGLVVLLSASLALSSCGIIIINRPDAQATESLPAESSGDTADTLPDGGESTAEESKEPETAGYVPYEAPDYKKQAKALLAALPEYDFGGIAVTIAGTSADSYLPSSADTEVSAARIVRNTIFEKKYNTRLICTVYDKTQLLEQSKLALLSDSYLADLVSIPMSELGSFYSAGILMNLRSLPFTDYSAPYFNADAMEAASAGSGTWAALGDASRNDYHLYCVYFNRNTVEELGLEDPYELVRTGEWTWDKMLELSRAAAAIDGEAGHGSSLSLDGYIDLLAASTGASLSSSGTGVLPASLAAGGVLPAAVERLKELLSPEGAYFSDPTTALGSFYNGNMLFYTERLTVAQWINDMREPWGLLPLPKLSEEQSGYSGVADRAQPVLVVLSHNANIESTAHFLQGYNAASCGYIAEEFKNTLMLRTLRDNRSVEMLDYVTSAVSYDFAVMFGGAYTAVASATLQAVRDAVAGSASLEALVRARAPYMDSKMRSAFKIY